MTLYQNLHPLLIKAKQQPIKGTCTLAIEQAQHDRDMDANDKL
jgi:hypothetical protein